MTTVEMGFHDGRRERRETQHVFLFGGCLCVADDEPITTPDVIPPRTTTGLPLTQIARYRTSESPLSGG